jgi:cyclopropane fatty-acyl-phospholipid synthase-like methyltransferase
MGASEIKTMGLYTDVHRVLADLREEGVADGADVDVLMVSKYDSMHYEGTDAIDRCIAHLQPTERTVLLDVGAGIGGPARYLAHRTGCKVVAVEMQPDEVQVGTELCRRTGLSKLVHFECADFLKRDPNALAPAGFAPFPYDAVVSWLTFLHIPDKGALFSRCFSAVKPGGTLWAEDFFERGAFAPSELASLETDVYASKLTTREQYVSQLEAAGFVDVVFTDLTAVWTEFVTSRLAMFEANTARHERVYGAGTVAALRHFYQAIVTLFQGGNLGGVQVHATRPLVRL